MANPIDYTSGFGDLSRGFLAAQTVVSSSKAGKAGLIRVIIEDGAVKFFSVVGNKPYDTFEEARQASRLGPAEYLTSLDVFAADAPVPGSISPPGLGSKTLPAPFAEDRSGAGRQIFKDMINRLENLSGREKQILVQSGIDVDSFIKRGQMFQSTYTLDDDTIFAGVEQPKRMNYEEKIAKYEEVQERVRRFFRSVNPQSDVMGQGIQVLEADNAIKVIGFRLADPSGATTQLNSYQANLLASVLGNDFLNPEMFRKLFSPEGGSSQIAVGTSSVFSGKALKIAKRLKAAFGDRPISLAGDDIQNFISNALEQDSLKAPKVGKVRKINTSLADHVLITDFEFDVMRNWAFDDRMENMTSVSGQSLRGKEEKILYKNLKSGNYVDSVVGFFTGNEIRSSGDIPSRRPANTDLVSERQLNILKEAIRDIVSSDRGGGVGLKVYDEVSGEFGSDVLKRELGDTLRGKGLSDEEVRRLQKVAGAMMTQAELAKDGADVANARFLRAQVNALDRTIAEIESALLDPNLSPEDKVLLRDRIQDIKKSRKSFQSALDHGGQVTGRISVKNMSTAKNIVAVADLEEGLKDVAFILNKTSFKKETSMAGRRENITEFINLSGMVSDYADNVKVDYAAAAAHGSIFATPEQFEAAEQRANILMRELDDAIENNIFSPRIRSILDRVASSDAAEFYEDMNEFSRIAATRAKEQARVISNYLERGGNVSQNVELVNALFDIVGREIYRYDSGKDEAKIILANVYRFGIDSEAGLLGRTKYRNIGGYQQYQASEIFLGGRNGVVDLDLVPDIMVNGESFNLSEEIIKFRIADHKVLVSEDAVARYMHALGGFDLDDKSLPIVTRFQTSSGVEKLAFNMLRQPTGPEESMFLLPNFDSETVRSLLSRDEMRFALENLQGEFSDFSQGAGIFDRMTQDIQRRGINRFDFDLSEPGASARVRREYESSMRLLTSIMEGDGSVGGLYNYEDQSRLARNVEQAVLDLLRYSEASGFTTISDVTQRQARKISRFGTSSLMSPPGVGEVGYTSQGIFKLLDKEGVFDITESMAQALRQAGYDESFVDRFINFTDPSIENLEDYSPFDSKMRFLAQNITDEHQLSALYSTAMGFNSADRVVSKSNSALGAYINASMVVSSMLDQYQDFLFDVNTQHRGQIETVYNKLLEYNIGLISQENAIDISVNQGGSRSLAREKVRISTLAQLSESEDFGRLLDTDRLNEVISRLHGEASLDALNESITPGIIKQTAFIRTVSESMGLGYSGGYGFDYDLFKSRMLADPESIVEYMGIYLGEMREAANFIENDLGMRVTNAQRDLMNRMQSLYTGFTTLSESNPTRQQRDVALSEIDNFLRNESGMFLTGERKDEYANVSRMTELSASFHRMNTEKRRDKFRVTNIRQKQSLDSALSFTTVESRQKAKDIISEYMDDLESFRKTRLMDIADSGIESETIRRLKVLDDLYEDIARSSRLENVSRYDLLTAIDSELLDKKIDIAVGKVLPEVEGGEAVSEMIRSVSNARSLRSLRESMNNDIANIGQTTYKKISDLVESYDGDNFAERVKSYVDANTKRGIISGLNDMEQRLVERLLAKGQDVGDLEDIRRLSKHSSEAGRLAAEFLSEEMAIYGAFTAYSQYDDNLEDFENLIRYGTAQTQADLADEMGDAFDNFVESDPDVKNTQYKRIADKINEKEFIDFIKKPAIKKTLYGMAALIGFSFAYQGYKDRTHSDMAGPPLLPGGSAYETRISPGDSNLEDIYYQGYNPGVSYQVSLHGDQNSINNFRRSIGDLNYGNLTTTMYSNLPRLGRDLYADVAPDF